MLGLEWIRLEHPAVAEGKLAFKPKNTVIFFYNILEKVPPYGRHFPSSCRGLQWWGPSGPTVGPSGPAKKSVMKFFQNFFFFFKFFFGNFITGNFFKKFFYALCILHCAFAFCILYFVFSFFWGGFFSFRNYFFS